MDVYADPRTDASLLPLSPPLLSLNLSLIHSLNIKYTQSSLLGSCYTLPVLQLWCSIRAQGEVSFKTSVHECMYSMHVVESSGLQFRVVGTQSSKSKSMTALTDRQLRRGLRPCVVLTITQLHRLMSRGFRVLGPPLTPAHQRAGHPVILVVHLATSAQMPSHGHLLQAPPVRALPPSQLTSGSATTLDAPNYAQPCIPPTHARQTS